MPDQRKHRGPHPEDHELFSGDCKSSLLEAAADLSWLLSKGYATNSALKLVGDRYSLLARQRVAVARCACSERSSARRARHRVYSDDLQDQTIWIDGYNVLTSLEAALSRGVILRARDGCYRDMASMHGSYRKVEETVPAVRLVGEFLSQRGAGAHWLLDQPVSNSGRLKGLLSELADEHGWPWRVDLVADPDVVLVGSNEIVASADSGIIDRAARWFNLARTVIDTRIGDAWIVDLS